MVIGDSQWRRELARIICRLRQLDCRDLAKHVLELGRHCIATRAENPTIQRPLSKRSINNDGAC